MKISYKDLLRHLSSNPSASDLSNSLFQLGHEHELENNIFDIEITPNRGDCLSLRGILRELSVFYSLKDNFNIYQKDIKRLKFNFVNKSKHICKHISFLKIEIDENSITNFKGSIKEYFDLPDNKQTNFFTDISNFLSYETGQPTHCYDSKKVNNSLIFEEINYESMFDALTGDQILLRNKNAVFKNNNEIISLAGIMGGKSTSCSKKTNLALIECAYFNPESIIGKSLKYGIKSDASYKFERGVDPISHENVLRRFIKIVEDHSKIKNVEILLDTFDNFDHVKIGLDSIKISKIIGLTISEKDCVKYLSQLGFNIKNNIVLVPSYRSDVNNNNDLAEEIARLIGYDNIPRKKININTQRELSNKINENKLKSFLVDNGFNEVINFPFASNHSDNNIKIDNPLDSSKKFLRTSLKDSLLENLFYNERRQHESIKLFEISDLYCKEKKIKRVKKVGLIASGRVGKNFENFSKKITKNYIQNFINEIFLNESIKIETIDRNKFKTKLKNEIIFCEFDMEELNLDSLKKMNNIYPLNNYVKYEPISEFPSSYRDLSFSISNFSKLKELERFILNVTNEILVDVFVFDYFHNKNKNEIKLGVRFIFQSKNESLTDDKVDDVLDDIISESLRIESVKIPGLG